MLGIRFTRVRTALLLVALFAIQACSSTKMSVAPTSTLALENQNIICGTLNYSGANSDYIPKIINQSSSSSDRQLSYAYEVKYNVHEDEIFEMYNPFLILGIPKSSDYILVSGQLHVSGPDSFSKFYRHAIDLTKTDSLFSDGDTLSEIRRKGLKALRDSIDEMVLADLALLTSRGFTCTNSNTI